MDIIIKKSQKIYFVNSIIYHNLLFSIFLLLIVGLYVLSLVQIHTFDALSYAYAAKVGLRRAEIFLHPHHLIYNPLSFCIYKIGLYLGWKWDIILILQLTNIFYSILSLLIFSKLLRQYVDFITSILMVLILTFSNGFWLFSVEVEVYALSTLFIISTAYLILLPVKIKYFEIKVSLVLGISILAHQLNILFFLVIAAGIILQEDVAVKKLKRLFSIAIITIIFVTLPYAIAVILLGYQSPENIIYYLTTYVQLGQWGQWGQWDPINLVKAMVGFSKALINIDSILIVLKILAISFLGIVVLFVYLKSFKIQKKTAAICTVWFLAYALFITWWEPHNFEFWIITLPPTLIVSAIVVNWLSNIFSTRKIMGAMIFIALGLAVFNWNYTFSKLLDISQDKKYQVVQEISPCVSAGDTILITPNNLLPWLSYYGQLEVYSVNLALYEAKRDYPEVVAEMTIFKLQNFIDSTLSSKKDLFVFEEILLGHPISNKTNIDGDELSSLFEEYSFQPTKCNYIHPDTQANSTLYVIKALQ
jgi:hypothetical protein